MNAKFKAIFNIDIKDFCSWSHVPPLFSPLSVLIHFIEFYDAYSMMQFSAYLLIFLF